MWHLPKFFPNIPLMALTATATPAVKENLRDLLGRDCITLESSVNRPNIYLEAHELKLPQNDPKHGQFASAIHTYIPLSPLTLHLCLIMRV